MAYGSIDVTAGSGTTLTTVTAGANKAFVKAVGLDSPAGTYQVISINDGTADAGCMRVTLANDGDGVVTLKAGTAEFGKLAAGTAEIGNVKNAGVFVTQVDGAALTALQLIDNPVAVLGTATYLEGTTSGNIIGAVRNDTLAALAGTDNEIAPLQVNATGALYVAVNTSALPSGAATSALQLAADHAVSQGTATTGTGAWPMNMTEDTTDTVVRVGDATNKAVRVNIVAGSSSGTQYTIGTDVYSEATTVVTAAGVVRKDSAGSLADTDGEVSALQVDSVGALRVTGGGGGTQYTLGTDVYSEAVTAVTAAGVVRVDSESSLADTDGEISALQVNATGSLRVDVTAALPAGTNAIGKLAANSGVDIGDVDILSVIPGTAATNLGKAIAGTVGVTDTGVAGLGEVAANQTSTIPETAGQYTPLRVSTLGNLHTSDLALSLCTGTDGSAGPTNVLSVAGTESGGSLQELRVDSDGHLQIDVVTAPSTAVTNAGTFATQVDGDALTALQTIDNIVSGSGANISQINGVTPLMNEGAAGTGSHRVTIAQAEPVYSDGQGTPQYHMSVMKNSSQIIWNGAAFDIAYATVTATASGDNTVVDVSAVGATGDRVLMLAYVTVCAGTVKETGSWKTGSTSRSGVMGYAADGGGGAAPFNEAGWFLGAADEDLIFNNVAGSDIGGHVTYALVQ